MVVIPLFLNSLLFEADAFIKCQCRMIEAGYSDRKPMHVEIAKCIIHQCKKRLSAIASMLIAWIIDHNGNIGAAPVGKHPQQSGFTNHLPI